MNIAEAKRVGGIQLGPWILATRPKTLPAGIAPVVLGCALAIQVGAFQWVPAILCLFFSMLIQIGCNFANDYFDYRNGVDTEDRVGFKRMVASGVIAPEAMKLAVVMVLTLAFIVGCGLIAYGGWWLLGVGIASIVCAVMYTAGPYPIAYHGFGDLFVFIFYGLVAVMVTFYVQSGYFSYGAFWGASGFGLLAANIRLVNDMRDIETDKRAGKKTLPIKLGYMYGCVQYLISNVLAFTIPIVLMLIGFSKWVLLTYLLLPIVIYLTARLMRANDGEEYNKLLAQTAKLSLAYSILLSMGIMLT